jgi:4-amino-4-deoxy-L-arabinose transferase-like glycosyltransferase
MSDSIHLRHWEMRSVVKVLLIALMLNAFLVLYVVPELSEILSPLYGIGFADDYDKLARNLALGNGYRLMPDMAESLMREPGYPLFLAGVFRILGDSLESARIANLLLSAGIVVLIMALGRKITSDSTVPVLAVLIFLLHPGTLIAETRGGVEILFTLLLMFFMLILHKALETEKYRHYFAAGLALGLVGIVRSTPLLFPAFLAVYFLIGARDNKERVHKMISIGLLFSATVLVMSPWVIRNYTLTHEFHPTTSAAGVAAQAGQYICENLSFDKGMQQVDDEGAVPERERLAAELGYANQSSYYQYFYTTRNEVDFSKHLLSKTISKYRQNPGFFAKCVAKNLVGFWFLGKTWPVTWINVSLQLPFVAVAIVGAYILWRRRQARRVAIIVLFIFYLVAIHAPIFAQARYSIPLVPFMSILASVALVKGWRDRGEVKGT